MSSSVSYAFSPKLRLNEARIKSQLLSFNHKAVNILIRLLNWLNTLSMIIYAEQQFFLNLIQAYSSSCNLTPPIS